jgi:hypothetical protein
MRPLSPKDTRITSVKAQPRRRIPSKNLKFKHTRWVDEIVDQAAKMGKGAKFQERLAEFLHRGYDPYAVTATRRSLCQAVDLGIAAGETGILGFGSGFWG